MADEEPPDKPPIDASATPGFALSPEQADTAALLERLLGNAIAERYVDFCRLAAGATDLSVTIPLAGHALREIESSIRATLAVPLDAEAVKSVADEDQDRKVSEALQAAGLKQDNIDRAIKSLQPKINHATQIRLICERLGLAPDGDIANAWVSLSQGAGQTHRRSFHRVLRVDAEFRKEFQEPFELFVRGVMVALEGKYSTLMQRVEHLARMNDAGRAAKLFESEIPGAPPLQWHFFQTLKNPAWIPHLIHRQLTREPQHDPVFGMKFRQWPVGFYLLQMAKLHDGKTPEMVAQGLRTVANSKNTDVVRTGLDIIAALPSKEAASVSDILVGWLTSDSRHHYMTSPQQTIVSLVAGGEIKAALDIAQSVYQLVDEGGSIATLHAQHMYEHFLPETVKVLVKADPLASLEIFSDLLLRGVVIKGHYSLDPPEDHTHYTAHAIAGHETRTYEPYDALINAVRDIALAAMEKTPDQTAEIAKALISRGPRIFKRIAMHALAKNASAAPELSATLLTDKNLIGQSWCEDEYSELAVAWFPSLIKTQQDEILAYIDAMPDEYRANWERHFEEHQKRPPEENDQRIYDGAVFRDAVRKWREVLPTERKQDLDEIVAEVGDPDVWRTRFFQEETSPLTGDDFATKPVSEVIEFLRTWQPQPGPQKQTITALGQQLRQAVEKEPVRFAEEAEKLATLRPIYVRRILEGFESVVRSQKNLPWGPILNLMEIVIARVEQAQSVADAVEGDDQNWNLACSTTGSLLRLALGQGASGISYEFSSQIFFIIGGLLRVAPKKPETNDFEKQFEKHTYFSAEQTMRGRAVELLIMHLFWESKHQCSPTHEKPHSALSIRTDIREALEAQLKDRSANGRIPRAIMGRWLQMLSYFGTEWLFEHAGTIFPDGNDLLRHAAWRGHLLNDNGPVRPLLPKLLPSYLEEIERLARGDVADQQQDRDDEVRGNRLGEYVLITYLFGDAPLDTLMKPFWNKAPSAVRKHAIWFLGTQLQFPPDRLPEKVRLRGLAYWDARLAAGIAANDKEPFREELGGIASWCRHPNIDAKWLLDQMKRMLSAGFAPSAGYTVVEWLAKLVFEDVEGPLEVLQALLKNPHLDHWTYATHKDSIRTILAGGMQSENSATVKRAEETISLLASLGETEYLDLIRSSDAPNV